MSLHTERAEVRSAVDDMLREGIPIGIATNPAVARYVAELKEQIRRAERELEAANAERG